VRAFVQQQHPNLVFRSSVIVEDKKAMATLCDDTTINKQDFRSSKLVLQSARIDANRPFKEKFISYHAPVGEEGDEAGAPHAHLHHLHSRRALRQTLQQRKRWKRLGKGKERSKTHRRTFK